jgi:hypothetical protein
MVLDAKMAAGRRAAGMTTGLRQAPGWRVEQESAADAAGHCAGCTSLSSLNKHSYHDRSYEA